MRLTSWSKAEMFVIFFQNEPSNAPVSGGQTPDDNTRQQQKEDDRDTKEALVDVMGRRYTWYGNSDFF